MASTNKTDYVGLNNWSPTDKPEMADFNSDNQIIDRALQGHIENGSVHVTDAEKRMWQTPYAIDMYYGDGRSSQTITLNCGFEPSFCLVFASNATPGIIDIPNNVHYNYFGIATNSGSMTGLDLFGNSLIVSENPSMYASYEKRSYNEIGRTYVVIAMR